MEMEAKQGFALSFRSVLFSLSPSIPLIRSVTDSLAAVV
jgi:hypothetical protein